MRFSKVHLRALVTADWRELYPFESRFFDRGDGIRMHYIDEGGGDPVVMVHGNPTWSFYYRELARALKQAGHRVIAPDHVGMGLSDKPCERRYEHTLRNRLRDLERLLSHLAPGPVTLVVHDWGGPIGLGWALREPARVKALVILNTAAFLPPEGHRLPWQLAPLRTALGPLLVQGANLFCLGAASGCARKTLSPVVRAGLLAPYDSWEHRHAVLRFVQDIPRRREDAAHALLEWMGQELHRLAELPALIAWGKRDFVFGDAFLDEWRRRLPQAQVREFRDAGHYVLEDARDELIPLIRDFASKQVPQGR